MISNQDTSLNFLTFEDLKGEKKDLVKSQTSTFKTMITGFTYNGKPVMIKEWTIGLTCTKGSLRTTQIKSWEKMQQTSNLLLDEENISHVVGFIIRKSYRMWKIENLYDDDLQHFVIDEWKEPLSNEIVTNWTIQICKGVAALERTQTILKNLYPRNILLERKNQNLGKIQDLSNYRLKITDFDESPVKQMLNDTSNPRFEYKNARWSNYDEHGRQYHTATYAVKALQHPKRIGFMINFMLSGKLPKHDKTDEQVGENYLDQSLPELTELGSELLKNLIMSCWNTQVNERPNVCQMIDLLEK